MSDNSNTTTPMTNTAAEHTSPHPAHHKTKRLSAALYLITDLLHDSEPLKWRLREHGVELVSWTLHTQKTPRTANQADVIKMMSDMIYLLELTHAAGLISEMNYTLLRKECEMLMDMFQDAASTHSMILSEEFFGVEMLSEPRKREQTSKSKQATTKEQKHKTPEKPKKDSQGHDKRQTSDKVSAVSDNTRQKNTHPRPRQEVIITLFKDGREHTVSDIAHRISGVSEKTIQRDVAALVGEGKLSYTGERRWRKYFRVQGNSV